MKFFFLFIFLISCSSVNFQKSPINNNLNFDREMTFEEFEILVDKYNKSKDYPNIDE